MTQPHSIVRLLHAAVLAGLSAAATLAGPAPALAEVGVAAAVNQDARGTPPGAAPRVIALGQQVVFNEQVLTDANGQVQVLLLDGTTFTVGPNSDLTIDEFVFDPNTGDAKVVASVTKGAFRFIGAKTSQTAGGATIKSPVGTIGVRGGSVVCSFDSGGQMLCMMPFGKGVDIAGNNGKSCKLFKPGWLCAFDQNGNYIETRKATPIELGLIAAALAGKGNGGAVNIPDDQTVQNSNVPDTNSNLPDTIPISVLQEAVKANPLNDEVNQTIEQATADTVRNDIAEQETEEPTTLAGRVLTSPGTYQGPEGPVNNPGGRGLVGSTPENDQVIVFTLLNGRLVATGPNVNIDLPDLTGSQGDTVDPGNQYPTLQAFDIGPGGDAQASSGGTPLEGVAYAGAGDFAAYFLGAAPSDNARALPTPVEPVYVIIGTATPAATQAGIMDDANIRRYTLTPDAIQEQPVPFFNADGYGNIDTDPSKFSSTDLYVVEGNATQSDKMTGFQSWVSIDGTGPNQKSAVGVNVGAVETNGDGQLAFNGTRGGSYRTPDGDLSGYNHAMQGRLASQSSGSGGHVFGPDANNMVIGNDQANSGAFYDDPLFNGGNPDSQFGTQHVASLVEKTPQSNADRVDVVTERRGFMAGIAVSNAGTAGSGDDSTYIVTNAPAVYAPQDEGYSYIAQPNLTITKDPISNEFRAEGTVYDAYDWGEGSPGQNGTVDSLQVTVGKHQDDGGVSFGDSSYVDDTKYGATQNLNPNNSAVTLDAEYYEEPEVLIPTTAPSTYMVSGRANPIPGYQHCTCAFIDWGWWGTTVTTDVNGDDPGGVRTDSVHMGTWVAGDITHPDNLPFSGEASYDGTALGTVSRDTGDGHVVEYQASGSLHMEYDFSYRQGQIAINNFDDSPDYNPGGYNLSGTMYDQSSGTESLFGGDIYDYSAGAYGQATGAFVDDNRGATPNVAAGVIGNFNFTAPGVSSSGTFAGERTPDI